MSESKHCRGCFDLIDQKLQKTINLNEKMSKNEITFAQFLHDCTGLNLDQNITEREIICTSCKKKLIGFHKFKEKILETDKKFKELQIQDKSESVMVEIKVEMKTEPDDWESEFTHNNDDYPFEDEGKENKSENEEEETKKKHVKKIGRPRTKIQKKPAKKILDHKYIRRYRHRDPQRLENIKMYKRNDEGLFECPKENCPGIFRNLGHLEMHLENKHPETDQKIFPCVTCGEEFPTFVLQKRHIYKFHTPRPYICDICGNDYPFMESIRTHMVTHMEDRKKERAKCACPICGKLYVCQANMIRHRKEVHFPKELIPKPYVCSVCGTKWSTRSKLKAHMKHHDTPEFFCDFCSKGFSLKGALSLHMQTHMTDRPFFCDICGKTYKTKYQLREHQLSHNEERTLKCSMCPATFKQPNSLRTHEVQVHTVSGPISCEICGKLCKNKSSLKTHMALHSTKAFDCPNCDKTYKVFDTLRRHIQRVHLGLKKRHECSVCKKNLWSRKHIAEHIEETHKDVIMASGKTADELVSKYWTSDPSGANLGEMPPKGILGRPMNT